MPISDFYRGNTRDFTFSFLQPNPLYTGEPPAVTVTAVSEAVFDDVTYPVDISSSGVITENWTLTFDSATEYEIVGDTAGLVGRGNISVDAHPVNPAKGTPYFTLPKGGWDTKKKFASGDALVFSTIVRNVPEDITDLVVTLTFIDEDDGTVTLQTSATAGDSAGDSPANGIMNLRLNSGESALLVKESYKYGFERRTPDGADEALDIVRTIEEGKVKILTPAKAVTAS